jgi:hypothetical protein
MELHVDLRAKGKLRLVGLIVIGILLIALPAGAGIFLLRKPVSAPSVSNAPVEINGDDGSAISDEVYDPSPTVGLFL